MIPLSTQESRETMSRIMERLNGSTSSKSTLVHKPVARRLSAVPVVPGMPSTERSSPNDKYIFNMDDNDKKLEQLYLASPIPKVLLKRYREIEESRNENNNNMLLNQFVQNNGNTINDKSNSNVKLNLAKRKISNIRLARNESLERNSSFGYTEMTPNHRESYSSRELTQQSKRRQSPIKVVNTTTPVKKKAGTLTLDEFLNMNKEPIIPENVVRTTRSLPSTINTMNLETNDGFQPDNLKSIPKKHKTKGKSPSKSYGVKPAIKSDNQSCIKKSHPIKYGESVPSPSSTVKRGKKSSSSVPKVSNPRECKQVQIIKNWNISVDENQKLIIFKKSGGISAIVKERLAINRFISMDGIVYQLEGKFRKSSSKSVPKTIRKEFKAVNGIPENWKSLLNIHFEKEVLKSKLMESQDVQEYSNFEIYQYLDEDNVNPTDIHKAKPFLNDRCESLISNKVEESVGRRTCKRLRENSLCNINEHKMPSKNHKKTSYKSKIKNRHSDSELDNVKVKLNRVSKNADSKIKSKAKQVLSDNNTTNSSTAISRGMDKVDKPRGKIQPEKVKNSETDDSSTSRVKPKVPRHSDSELDNVKVKLNRVSKNTDSKIKSKAKQVSSDNNTTNSSTAISRGMDKVDKPRGKIQPEKVKNSETDDSSTSRVKPKPPKKLVSAKNTKKRIIRDKKGSFRGTSTKPKKRKTGVSKVQKSKDVPREDNSIGLRRSRRKSVPPLAHWKGDRLVNGEVLNVEVLDRPLWM